MHIADNIKIALFNIRTNLMRSLLTMLGIIIGVAAVITIITCGTGGRDYIVDMIEDMGGTRAVNITVNSTLASANDYITSEDLASIKTLDGVQYVSPVVMGMGMFEAGVDTSGIMMTIGGTPDLEPILNTGCKYGRFFSENEYRSGKLVGIIASMNAQMIFGTENVVGESISYSVSGKTVKIKIIGVMDFSSAFGGDSAEYSEMLSSVMGSTEMTMASGMIIIPSTAALELTGASERYETVYIMASDDSMLSSIGELALDRLESRHNNHGNGVYSAINMASMVDLLDTVITVFTLFIAGVSAISLVVGGIGVMNIMLVTVTERTREIGIRKALGARTRSILLQFLTESVIICLIGGVIGLLMGVVLSAVASALVGIKLTVEWWSVLLAVGFSSFIGIFFGIYPARTAAKMPPIEALRKD